MASTLLNSLPHLSLTRTCTRTLSLSLSLCFSSHAGISTNRLVTTKHWLGTTSGGRDRFFPRRDPYLSYLIRLMAAIERVFHGREKKRDRFFVVLIVVGIFGWAGRLSVKACCCLGALWFDLSSHLMTFLSKNHLEAQLSVQHILKPKATCR